MLFVSCLSVAFVVCQLYLFFCQLYLLFVSCICCLSGVSFVCQWKLLFVRCICCLSVVSPNINISQLTGVWKRVYSPDRFAPIPFKPVSQKSNRGKTERCLYVMLLRGACTLFCCVASLHNVIAWCMYINYAIGCCLYVMFLCGLHWVFFFWVVLTVATNSVVSCVRNETVYLAVWAGAPSCRKMKNSDISFM